MCLMEQEPNTPVIEAIGLVKRYGKFTAVNGLSLEVRSGEVFGARTQWRRQDNYNGDA